MCMLVSWKWAEDLLEGLGNLQENGKEDLLLPVAEQHQQPKGFQPILLTCSGPALPTSCLLHSGSRGMWLLLRLCLHSLQDTGGQLQDLGSLLVVYTSVLKQRGLVTNGGKGLSLFCSCQQIFQLSMHVKISYFLVIMPACATVASSS